MPEELLESLEADDQQQLDEPLGSPSSEPPAEDSQAGGEEAAKEPVTSLFEPDGKKLAGPVKDTLTKLKAENPEVAKLISKAVFRVAELDREFPGGLTEARELRDKVEELGGLEGIGTQLEGLREYDGVIALLEANDPAFVEDLFSSYPENAAAIAPAFISKYAEANPAGFASYIGRVVYGDLQRADVPLLMMRLGDVVGDNPKAVELFNQLNAYLGNFKTLADKPFTVPAKRAGEKAPRQEDLSKREEQLRSREWQAERDGARKSAMESAYKSALAGRTPNSEDRAQIMELFQSRAQGLAERLFPGWDDKSQRFIKAGNKDGYQKYMKSIYARVIPDAMASAVKSTLKGKPAAAAAQPGAAKPQAQPANGKPAASTGFTPVAKEPGSFDIDYSRTGTQMLMRNQAVLRDGRKVAWK